MQSFKKIHAWAQMQVPLFKMYFCLYWYMKKVFKKYLDIHSRGKSDENSIFDIVTSCSIFDRYIFSKNTF